jgi:L-alanine-DL-glutamate epimerase-like enolase superfamily enzyme
VDTIARIDIYEAKVPLTKPLSVGSAKITYRSYTIVKITTADGIEGIGYCYSRGLPMAQIINNVMTPIAIGNSAESPNDLRKEILAFNWQSAEHGTFTAALSALDLAMYDIQAKRLGKSVASMLGATRDRISVYSVVGYNYGPDEAGLIEEIEYARNRGINSFKIIVGGQTPERDAKRLEVLRKEVGEGVPIGVDAFRTFKTLNNAITRVNLIKEFGIKFVEDPFLESESLLANALRSATGVPISFGESLASSKMIAQVLDHDECDVLRIDALVVGGVDEFLTATSYAAKKGKSYSTHIHTEIHSQLAAATSNLYAGGLEYLDPMYEIDLFHHLLHSPIKIQNGAAILTSSAGFGIEWDWEAIQFFSRE